MRETKETLTRIVMELKDFEKMGAQRSDRYEELGLTLYSTEKHYYLCQRKNVKEYNVIHIQKRIIPTIDELRRRVTI